MAVVQRMQSLTAGVYLPQNIARVKSELWTSLVDVLRTVTVWLLFTEAQFIHHRIEIFRADIDD
ncbi:MAG: hypothetical protein M3O33_05160 [Cyanobacteriota bacterium]|nr:hypothetical protein [Cyanobacteriota bacterium]